MVLYSEVGRFALKDNTMIFGNIVWLCEESDKNLYHLINLNDTKEIENNMDIYIKKDYETKNKIN